MKSPLDQDFTVKRDESGVHVVFVPTNSHFDFRFLADAADIAKYGRLSSDVIVRHAKTGDTASYQEAEVAAAARRLAEKAIMADGSQPATLSHGGKSVHCHTLQEAVLAWMRLPEQERRQATIRADDGTEYNADQIDRLYNGK